MFFLRSIVDNFLYSEKQTTARFPTLPYVWSHVQKDRNLPLKLPARERTLCEPLITIHCTDVKGGFGVAKKHKDRFEAALLDRYAGLAYHAIASRRVGSVYNQSLLRRTSHGNGGNRGAGFAVDCAHGEPLSEELASAAFRALYLLVDEVWRLTGDIVSLVPHRVFSASRRNDPGEHVWKIVSAVEIANKRCRIDYSMFEAGGLPIPVTWDDRALFNSRGELLDE